MSKWIAAGMIGFWLGMKCVECKKTTGMQKMKKQMMKKLGI